VSLFGLNSDNQIAFRISSNTVFSQVAEVIVIYFALTLNLATTFCFLIFQEIKLSLIETQYPSDLLSDKDHIQSTSE